MPYYILQGGSSLQMMSDTGTLTTLTLPAGVTIDSTKRGRFAILGRNTVMVNSPSVNLWIDPEGTVRPMVLRPPATQCNVAAGSSTGLTGAYQVKASFIVTDPDTGSLISESALSPASASVTLANQDLAVTGIPVSFDAETSARRLYRTASGGSVYYRWVDIDGNTQTAYTGNLSDAALALLPASPTLGAPPGTFPGGSLELIASWKDRFWGRSGKLEDIDTTWYSENLSIYKWPASNGLVAKPQGQDRYGITAYIPRRDELGICKRDRVCKVVGNSSSDFEMIIVVEGVGCVAPDSVAVIRDIGYFLSYDGVYQWGPSGVASISRDKAHAWFATDTYFNRGAFETAVGRWNSQYDLYELLLPAAGGTTLNRWVAYDIRQQTWLGPHITSAFTPTLAGYLHDANALPVPFLGDSTGFISKMDPSATNDWSTAVAFDVTGKAHSGNTPDIEKQWLELSVISKIQSAGTLTVTPYVGSLSASAGAAISHDLTSGRQRLRRLGNGRFCKLRFQHNTVSEGCEVYGYELPYFELGRR